MSTKRKAWNFSNRNDHISFFNPVYSNENNAIKNDENNPLIDGIPRSLFGVQTGNDLSDGFNTVTMANDEQETSSKAISPAKIINRIKQTQLSIEQAEAMLESVEKMKHLVPDNNGHGSKLHSIIVGLQEQQNGYINLLNLITATSEERSSNSTTSHSKRMNTYFNDDDDDDNDDDRYNNLSLRHHTASAVHPCTEQQTDLPSQSKVATSSHQRHLSDNVQASRNDHSNYNSLLGSLQSDTITWKDQQSTSDDEETYDECEKETDKNIMLHKEQLRAFQGQQRALFALKQHSEQCLADEELMFDERDTTNLKQTNNEHDLLLDINTLRNRLTSLRNVYEEKLQNNVRRTKIESNKSPILIENRLKNLEHVRQRLDALEQIILYYQTDPDDEKNEPNPGPIENINNTALLAQQKSPSINNIARRIDQTSDELVTKRLELEQAKTALARLQQMVQNIQPSEYSLSANSTPTKPRLPSINYNFELSDKRIIHSPTTSQQNRTEILNMHEELVTKSKLVSQSSPMTKFDTKLTTQYHDIEGLVESRQRLHTIKDQIVSLQQTMTTPLMKPKCDPVNETNSSLDHLNDSQNIRPSYRSNQLDYNESGLYDFESDSTTECEENNLPSTKHSFSSQRQQSHKKQTNFCALRSFHIDYDQRSQDLYLQINEIHRCLSSFIEEQKLFNHNIEQSLLNIKNSSSSSDMIHSTFEQIQQQNLTQSLVLSLNTAYREIAALQSEVNALQSENNRLTSSISFDNQYHHQQHLSHGQYNSKALSLHFDPTKSTSHSQLRSKVDEQWKYQNLNQTRKHLLENSIKTSLNTQDVRKQMAIQLDSTYKITTPFQREQNAEQFISNNFTNDKEGSRTLDVSKPIVNYARHHNIDLGNDCRQNHHQHRSASTFSYEDKLANGDEINLKNFETVTPDTRPSYYTQAIANLDNIDTQTIDLQVKSTMLQLIPFMRLRRDEIFSETTMKHILERIMFLFKQQPDLTELIRRFQNRFSESIEKTIQEYCGAPIRECAADLIGDISDVAFDQLTKYKMFRDTNNLQKQNLAQQNTSLLIQEENKYSQLHNSSAHSDEQKMSSFDDVDNDDNYQIELAESESRPLTLIGSDEEDNDADQEETAGNELETAVSRQETYCLQNESSPSTLIHSNGRDYVVVNHSTSHEAILDNAELNNKKINSS